MSLNEFDDWTASWTRLKTRGASTSDLSTALVAGAFRRDNAFQQLELLEQADDDEQLGDIVFGALRLCCELARRNRTAAGLMAIGAELQNTEETAKANITRTAARLLLGYQIADDVAHFKSIDSIDPGLFWSLGAENYNQVLTAAGPRASMVIAAALDLWRQLLPEVQAFTIEDVAAELRTKSQ
ncbi:hypothetical protein [Mycobacterium colombiense]